MGNLENISNLEFLQNNSKEYAKILNLLKENGVSHIRKIKGDKNGYYRAVIFSYIEKLVLKRNDEAIKHLLHLVET